jgi:hypothetical protein
VHATAWWSDARASGGCGAKAARLASALEAERSGRGSEERRRRERGGVRAAVEEEEHEQDEGQGEEESRVEVAHAAGLTHTVLLCYRASAIRGHPRAQCRLGAALFDAGRLASGVRWYRKAAQRNDSDALNALGCVYETGVSDVVARDLGRAEELYLRAVAAGGGNSAQRNLDVVRTRLRRTHLQHSAASVAVSTKEDVLEAFSAAAAAETAAATFTPAPVDTVESGTEAMQVHLLRRECHETPSPEATGKTAVVWDQYADENVRGNGPLSPFHHGSPLAAGVEVPRVVGLAPAGVSPLPRRVPLQALQH